MSVTTEKSTDARAIRPFTIEVDETDLDDLRARVAATRWPERETVEDDSQGVPLALMQDLAHYWATDYDWRKCEAGRAACHLHRDVRGFVGVTPPMSGVTSPDS
jgi:Epoxide hydrolase N terminus